MVGAKHNTSFFPLAHITGVSVALQVHGLLSTWDLLSA